MSDTPSSSSSPTAPGSPSDLDKLRQLERTFQVRHSDWLRLRQKVANLKDPVPYLASVGWTCIGITVSAILGLLAWLPINSVLPVKAHTHYTFITPLLIITAIASVLITAFTFTVWHQVKQIRVTTVENVLTDMDTIYEPYSHAKS